MNGSSLPSRTVTIASSSSANRYCDRAHDLMSARPSFIQALATGSARSAVGRSHGSAGLHPLPRQVGRPRGWRPAPVNASRSPCTHGLPNTLKEMPGTAQPTHALRRVTSRNVEDPETEGNPGGVGWTGFGRRASYAAAWSLRASSTRPSHHTASA